MTEPTKHAVVRRRGERGAHMVEAALTLSLLLAVIFGIFDFGFVLFLHQSMAHAARTGARYAAVHPKECTPGCATAKYVVLYGTPTNRGGNGIYGLQPSQVSVTRTGEVNTPEDRIEASISGYSYNFLTPFFTSGGPGGVNVKVTLPVENQLGL